MTDILSTRTPEWMHDPTRNCAIPDEFNAQETGQIADQWFPSEAAEARNARQLCDDCPVQLACLRYALDHPELEGIWGGTTSGQRVKLRASGRKVA